MFSRRKNWKVAVVFMIGSFISAAAAGPVGSILGRASFGCIVLAIISTGILYADWKTPNEAVLAKLLISIFLMLGCFNFYRDAKNGCIDFSNRWNENLAIIQQEKQAGNLDIYVNPIFPRNRFCAAYGLDDFKPEKDNNHWLNRGAAKYFGVHTIQSIKVETKK